MSGSKHLAFIVGLAAPVLAFLCFAMGGIGKYDGDYCADPNTPTGTKPTIYILSTARASVLMYVVSAVFAIATCVAWVNCCEQYGRSRVVSFEPMVVPAPPAGIPMYAFAPIPAAAPAAVPPAYTGL